MKKPKLHIPDDPTQHNIGPCLDALNYEGEITLKMLEAEAHALLKQQLARVMRDLGRLLRKRYAGCIARIEYPPSTGRNGFIRIRLNRLFDGFGVPVCQVCLGVSWRVDPMFGKRHREVDDRALQALVLVDPKAREIAADLVRRVRENNLRNMIAEQRARRGQ